MAAEWTWEAGMGQALWQWLCFLTGCRKFSEMHLGGFKTMAVFQQVCRKGKLRDQGRLKWARLHSWQQTKQAKLYSNRVHVLNRAFYSISQEEENTSCLCCGTSLRDVNLINIKLENRIANS